MSDNAIIKEKLEKTFIGLREKFGFELTNELVSRLENTISEFNEEVDVLIKELKVNAAIKEKFLEEIKTNNIVENKVIENDQIKETKEMSEWEKRLEALNKG